MNNKEIPEFIEKNICDFLTENQLRLYDVEYVKEGPNWFLKIFIDKVNKEERITIGDCELVTKYVNSFLDENDPIQNQYMLEVSSPGIDRKFKKESDFLDYAGRRVDIKLYKPINKNKEFTGELIGLSNGVVSIKVNNENLEFAVKDIIFCRLSIDF